jgi:hypothetical protein
MLFFVSSSYGYDLNNSKLLHLLNMVDSAAISWFFVFAPTSSVLLLFRTTTDIGTSVLMITELLIISHTYPPKKRERDV